MDNEESHAFIMRAVLAALQLLALALSALIVTNMLLAEQFQIPQQVCMQPPQGGVDTIEP